MVSTRTTAPGPDDRPSWADYWDGMRDEWQLAARDVCELEPSTRATATRYLSWVPGDAAAGPQHTTWYPSLDWAGFLDDLEQGRTTLSSTQRQLGVTAAGIALRDGRVHYAALEAAGYLGDVLLALRACLDRLEENF